MRSSSAMAANGTTPPLARHARVVHSMATADRPQPDPQPEETGLSDSAVGYEMEADAPVPRLPGQVIVRPDADDVIGALAADLMIHAQNCVRSFGDFHLALSGGSTPMPLYRRLMVDPAYRDLPWPRTHLWIVDERCVPPDDDRSNFKHIAGYLADHSTIKAENVHPIRAMDPEGDLAYERDIQQSLAWREKGHDRLDFVLLGMGGDGHTASLFPNSPALDADDRLVAANRGPTVTPPDRITMTYRLINGARFIAVLVTGEAKRVTIARVEQASPDQARELPILGIRPVGGAMRWYLDAHACPRPPRPRN